MTYVSLEKIATIIHDHRIPFSVNHSELQNQELGDEVEFLFPKGMFDHRMKQLSKLGYNLKSWVWEPKETDPIFTQYRGIFVK